MRATGCWLDGGYEERGVSKSQNGAPYRIGTAANAGDGQPQGARRRDKRNRRARAPRHKITNGHPGPLHLDRSSHASSPLASPRRPPGARPAMGFAVHPAPGRPGDDARSLPPAGAADSARTSSSVSFSLDGDGGRQLARRPGQTLVVPSRRHRAGASSASRPARLFQKLRHALPLLTLTPRCGRLQVGTPAEVAAAASSSFSSSSSSSAPQGVSFSGAARPCRRVTGTLYGHRRGRVVLALQETPRCLPSLVVELALQTHALLRELGNPAGARIVLETERRQQQQQQQAASSDPAAAAAGGRKRGARAPPLLDEAAWTMFCNGRKTGYAVRREATDDDLTVMETLRAVSMGAGVLPAGRCSSPPADTAAADDEVPYMRGCFDHFVGSRDSESLYMIAPQGGGTGPELAVFFVRL
ncbi:hypothetical protein BS78_07G059700 [Paspalum vaginatum]|nr:hypothetical protein BS78_07G059700 [Paspalum vaginatum]